MIARYGAFAITWIVCGEYNLYDIPARVQKAFAIGRFIKDIDPYERAMSVHSWTYTHDRQQAWDEPWYDFIMLQGGHGGSRNSPSLPPESAYLDAYNRDNTKPVLESELNYEGIHGMTDDSVRLGAYRAIQSGAFGYTYGSHGLWYPTQDESDTQSDTYGPPIPWWHALLRPGAVQMGYLRSFYESIEWWMLEPRPDAISTRGVFLPQHRLLAKAHGDSVFAVYMPRGPYWSSDVQLHGLNPSKAYAVTWFDPRTGEFEPYQESIELTGDSWVLPERPNSQDWLLLVQEARD